MKVETTPAVLYAAKSTDDPRGSIETQIADAKAMAEGAGWAVAGSYSDEAKSAYHGSRGDGLKSAREHAARLAAEHGEAMLVVQHTDRLARGDGVQAQHLVEVLLWGRNAGVRLRSVQDDSTGENVLMAAMMGERNFEDSKRKAAATAAGKRRAAERGESTGSVPDGYRIEKTASGTSVSRSVEQDPERKYIYRLIWDLALDGVTVRSIVRELATAGYMTAPRRAKPRPFDAARVDKALNNPFYAGLIVSRGEIIGAGKWEGYVEPDDWYRLREERKTRTRHRSEPVGRPDGGLLARLARCECGSAMVQQRGGQRKDGSRRRTYTCRTHMHRPDGCAVTPFDAEIAERMVLDGLDGLLGQAGIWAKALLAGREAQRGRLTTEAEAAAAEVTACEAAIEQIVERYDAAVVAGDESKIELAERAMAQRKLAARQAATRHEAATDALATEDQQPEEDAEVALARLYETLSARLGGARDDVRALNTALREHFDEMRLATGEDGQIQITPVLSAAAVQGLQRDNRRAIESGVPNAATDHEHWSYDPDPDDPEHYVLTPEAPVLTGVAQPGKQRPSRLPHNTRPGSWPGTAGGSPRRNKRGGVDRPPRSPS
jgi:DNA invertase Pin-like site-specific DNA recombinase